MNKVTIHTDFIRLDQFLKLAELTASGGESKIWILEGKVSVNGEVETRRGRKLYPNDIVKFEETSFLVQEGP